MTPVPDRGERSYRGSGKLAGRKAPVTGGDPFIGRAAVIAFAREGVDVAINYYPTVITLTVLERRLGLPDRASMTLAPQHLTCINESGRDTFPLRGSLTTRQHNVNQPRFSASSYPSELP